MRLSVLAVIWFCVFSQQEAYASAQNLSPEVFHLSWYLIDFFIFFFLLGFFSRRFLLALWRKRRLHIQRQVEHGRRVLRHAEQALQAVKNRNRKLPEEIANVKNSVVKEGELKRQMERERARERITSFRSQVRSQIVSKRAAALSQLKEELVDLAMSEAEASLRKDYSERLDDRYQAFAREMLSGNVAESILLRYQGIENSKLITPKEQ